MADAYRSVFGAFPYAVRASESWFFRIYALVGTLFAVLVGGTMLLALIAFMGESADVQGGLFAFSRSLYVLLGFAAAAPLITPVLLVARRHRRGDAVHEQYDQAMAATGYLFLASLYAGLLASAPPELREPVSGLFAPIVELLYAAPRIGGIVPPTVAAIVMAYAHLKLRE